MVDKTRIKLCKANELSHISDEFRLGPGLKELVFGLGGSVAIVTHVDTDKLETGWED
jgi:hypothetical protein